jgi:NADH pyrophosphatase NudC (nudix superfamily)
MKFTMAPDERAVFYCGDEIILTAGEDKYFLAQSEIEASGLAQLLQLNCYAVPNQHTVPYAIWDLTAIKTQIEMHPNLQLRPLRIILELANPQDYQALLSSKQILNWDMTSQFCGVCGTKQVWHDQELAKRCPACGHVAYPLTAPAIVVLIARGHELLLARSPHFAKNVYSAIAGFVAPGESGEQTVVREVAEEVGLLVKNIQYFGCQMWPFPGSFMIAYHADYHAGELTIDTKELEDARWFSIDDLPPLPRKSSISRNLIEDYLAKYRPDRD